MFFLQFGHDQFHGFLGVHFVDLAGGLEFFRERFDHLGRGTLQAEFGLGHVDAVGAPDFHFLAVGIHDAVFAFKSIIFL